MLRAGRAAKPAQGGSGEGRGGPWRAVAALVGLPVGAGRRARQGGSAGRLGGAHPVPVGSVGVGRSAPGAALHLGRRIPLVITITYKETSNSIKTIFDSNTI